MTRPAVFTISSRFLLASSALAAFALVAFALGCSPSPKSTEGTQTANKAEAAREAAQHDDAPATQPAGKKGKGETPADRDQTDKDGVTRRGTTLSAAKPLTVPECFSQSKALAGKSVKVAGVVQSVCKAKGCWFIIAKNGDKETQEGIRIGSKGYKFFMPRSSVGKHVVLEGDFEIKEVTVAQAQHLEDDRVRGTDEKAKKITKIKQELRIAAVAVEMQG